jgi:hypothetical protein
MFRFIHRNNGLWIQLLFEFLPRQKRERKKVMKNPSLSQPLQQSLLVPAIDGCFFFKRKSGGEQGSEIRVFGLSRVKRRLELPTLHVKDLYRYWDWDAGE